MKKTGVKILLLMLFVPILLWAGGDTVHLWQQKGKGRGQVKLTSYLPVQTDTLAPAVIICPGGSYFWLDRKKEGHDVAQWLQQNGIAAFVLEYRVGGKFNYPFATRLLYGGNRYPAMLMDVQMAIHYLRSNSDALGVNPRKVGVMGFSAGGHLSMLAAERYSPELLEKESVSVSESLRPDFVVPVYPVVTMTDRRYVHHRSRRGLMGEYKMGDRNLRRMLSLEHNVPDDCCPVFLLNAADDPVVHPMNSVLLDSALSAKNVNHVYTCFPVGGHGFGTKPVQNGADSYDWRPMFLEWLSRL